MSGNQIKKNELVAAISEETSVDKKSINAVVDSLCAILTKEVASGNAVVLPGVGKFMTRERPARTVRNPSTGATMQKEADRAVRVVIAKALKDAVN